MPKVRTKQVKLTLTEADAKRLEKLSENTGLAKSTLIKLMLSGTLRDLQKKPYHGGASSLVLAWCTVRLSTIL